MSKKIYGIYDTNPQGTGAMLAFGESDVHCQMQLEMACPDCDLSTVVCVEVTPALADTDGGRWAWLPGTGETVACTVGEAE